MRFEPKMGMVVFTKSNNVEHYIPLRHVRIIKENLDAGYMWWAASPAISITREDAALIHNVSWWKLDRCGN